jgi:hypothetical protein
MACEEAQEDAGLFRYRLSLRDGGMLEMFALFQIVDGEVEVRKYSFHWQDKHNHLVKRWDNATHHPEVSTYPHHVHDGEESNVVSHSPVNAEMILGVVSKEVDDA